jgi:DNA-binding IclR family transcriptional regulator
MHTSDSRTASADMERSPLFIHSLEKGLAVLLAFGPENETMNLAEIAAATGIGKSAAQRVAYTLEELGYLKKDPVTRRYSLSVATLGLGYNYLVVNRAAERANSFLLDLNRATKETVNLSEPDGRDMVFVNRFPTSRSTPMFLPLGRRLPMYCTSSGRAYLSSLSRPDREAILQASDRVAYTPQTITNVNELMELCEQAAEQGYAWAQGEFFAGDFNVGAAVLDASGRPIGAVSVSAPSTRWTMKDVKKEIAPLVVETARLLSTKAPSPQPASRTRKA